MNENEISKYIVDTAFRIHVELGPGLLESVYEQIMYYELVEKGFDVDSQVPIPVEWGGVKMKLGFRTDLIVNWAY